jgi:hypothetical protein
VAGLVQDAVLAQPVRADAERLEHGADHDGPTGLVPAAVCWLASRRGCGWPASAGAGPGPTRCRIPRGPGW